MIKLFGRWKRDSYDKKCIDNVSDPEKEPMKIWITSKSSVDIVYVQCLQIPSRQKVYYYGERDNEMFETTFSEVRNFIKELEPWDEIDSEIFDDSFTWFIAITHEDVSLVYGIENFNSVCK